MSDAEMCPECRYTHWTHAKACSRSRSMLREAAETPPPAPSECPCPDNERHCDCHHVPAPARQQVPASSGATLALALGGLHPHEWPAVLDQALEAAHREGPPAQPDYEPFVLSCCRSWAEHVEHVRAPASASAGQQVMTAGADAPRYTPGDPQSGLDTHALRRLADAGDVRCVTPAVVIELVNRLDAACSAASQNGDDLGRALDRLTDPDVVEAAAQAASNTHRPRWATLDEGERGDEMDCQRAALAAVREMLTKERGT